MSDTQEQVRNRVEMWKELILDPEREEDLTSLAPIVDSLIVDSKKLALMELEDE